MSISRRGSKWEVRWREADGRHLSRSFLRKGDADAFQDDVRRRRQLGPALAGMTPVGFSETVEPTVVDEAAIERMPPARRRRTTLGDDPRVLVRADITYAISSEPYDGWAKLGRTTEAPAQRLADLQCGNPRRLVIRSLWPVDAEPILHREYDRFRGEGEWFALPLEMLRDMRKLAKESDPHLVLSDTWPPRRIWQESGLHLGSWSAATIAQRFSRVEPRHGGPA